MFAGHDSAGACVSLTVTLKLQPPVLAEASVVMHVTIVVPTGNVDPEGGVQEVDAPGQLSDDVAAKFTSCEQRPGVLPTMIGIGQIAAGASVSSTVTLKPHVPVFDAASTAVQVTVVTPTGNVEPEAGTHVTVAPEQLSAGDGTLKLTTAEHWPEALATTTGIGQVTIGASVSFTVTVNVHSGPFAATQFTVVVPTWKNVPDAGKHVTVPHDPVIEGAG